MILFAGSILCCVLSRWVCRSIPFITKHDRNTKHQPYDGSVGDNGASYSGSRPAPAAVLYLLSPLSLLLFVLSAVQQLGVGNYCLRFI